MESSSSSSTFLTTTTIDQRKPSPVSRKSPKQKKKSTSITKPIKVRYISNPMKVQICASKFRDLVQELTGQDAVDLQPEPVYSPTSDHTNTCSPPCGIPTAENISPRVRDIVAECYEPLDGEEMFLPDQMSAGFSGFFSNGLIYNVNDFASIDSM